MSYLAKRGSVYYFRRIVPDDLRLALGKREIMLSLRTKDREEAKQLIPAQIIQSDALFASARKAVSVASGQRQAPSAPLVRLKREAVIFESDPASEDQESEIEALEPIMDALAAGKEVHAPPAIIARAARLLVLHEREMADINQEQAIGRLLAHKAKPSRVSEGENQAVDCGSDNSDAAGKGVYLDTDIVDLWAAERSPAAKTKDSYRRVAEWLHERIGRKSVEQFTRKDMLAFKDRLLADGQTP